MVILELLEENARLDKRKFAESQPVDYTLTDNTLLCVTPEISYFLFLNSYFTSPYVDRPCEGNLTFYSPFKTINRYISLLFIKMHILNIESLCVEPGVLSTFLNISLSTTSTANFINPSHLIHSLSYFLNNLNFKIVKIFPYFFISVNQHLLLDPVQEEYVNRDYRIFCVTNEDKDILFFEKNGKECSFKEILSVMEIISK
ncbi:hypothetical protein CWI37_1732p0010 [Hamiltosporidium tvaerminnensis]|uniref:Uncharacterized protein n=1 Tax=Hamiltosporidium tvaerminnensis TaxID=1176355 RepID=A0A4Q9KWL7_9MICR|nr:hypothetical protein LUQ84_002728 [Hamiltosporidium tvaerminnensis]TBT98489.1 hypothetical protein CWI37_1732p0010 [Hamiltosporidium tvaerminnensis]